MNIEIDYPINPKPRWTELKPNVALQKIIESNDNDYGKNLTLFLEFKDKILSISRDQAPERPSDPHWLNGFLPGLDAISLYSFLCIYNPKR